MTASQLFGIIASFLNLASMLAYFRQLRKSESIPNPATWLIWMVFACVNLLTYFLTTKGNVALSLLPLINTVGTILLFAYSLFRGKFAKIGKTETWSLALTLLIATYWRFSGNAIGANVALQLVLTISYYPTYIGLARKTLREKPLSWTLSALGYGILCFAVLTSDQNVNKTALAFPITNVLLNSLVALRSVPCKPNTMNTPHK